MVDAPTGCAAVLGRGGMMGWGGMMGAVLGSKAFLVVGSASREGGGGEEGEGGGGARSSRAAPFTGTALLLPLDWFLSVFWKACMSPLPVPGHQPQPRCPPYPLPGLLHPLVLPLTFCREAPLESGRDAV